MVDKLHISVNDLRDAINASYTKLGTFRAQRLKYIKEYIGNEYGDKGTPHPTPYNLINLYVSILSRRLAPTNPRAFVQTFDSTLKPTANSFELAVNRKIEDIHLGTTLGKFVIEALFGMGIIKTGLNLSDTVEVGGIDHDVGEPFAEIVEFEDFVWDLGAKTYEQVHFVGNRFSMTADEIAESGIFDEEALEKLAEHIKGGSQSNRDTTETANNLTANDINNEEVFKKRINLWDVWLPSENKVITFMDDDSSFALRVIDWEGPENGPYELLRFNEVPGNIMPIAPVGNLYKLHRLTNKLMTKVAMQGDRQKTVGLVQDTNQESAEKIVKAKDGEVIGVQGPPAVEEYNFGGPNPQVLALMDFVSNLFKMLAGNLDTLGGLEASAKTLGQEQLLDANSNEQIKGMATKVSEATGNIISSIGFYLFDDPLVDIPIEKQVEGVQGLVIPSSFNAMDIEGEFSDFGLTISPYSMQESTPGEQVQSVTAVMTQLAMPLQEAMAQQGLGIDYTALFKFIGDRGNMPELSNIIVSQTGQPLTDRDEKTSQPSRRPQQTRTDNFRHQVSDDSGDSPIKNLIGSFEEAGNTQ